MDEVGQEHRERPVWTQVSAVGFQWPARVRITGTTLTVQRLVPWAKRRTYDLRGAKVERRLFGVNVVVQDDEVRFNVPGTKRLRRMLLAHGATEFGRS